MLVDMKEVSKHLCQSQSNMSNGRQAGAKGKEIEEMWERETGDVGKKAKSLHTRYMRIKDSIACVKPEDHAKLHEARTAAMDDVEQQKKALDAKLWMIIAEKMKGLGASEDYSV